MIRRLYNSCYITNAGERAADWHFIQPPGREDEPYHIIYRLRLASRFHRTQMSGESDFVILTRSGIMVMEVKGGRIGYGEMENGSHGFYQKKGEKSKVPVDHPFFQVDGNADAIQGFLREKGVRDVFIGKMVCFPECVFEAEGVGFQYLWHLGTGKNLLETVTDFLDQQIATFREKQLEKHVAHPIQWKTLEEDDIRQIEKLLEPEFQPDIYRTKALLNREEAERRVIQGVHILSGLDENRRIMVHGPPGSGKTTYALKLITRLCLKEGKTGLYLCWNELLASWMKRKISETDIGTSEERIRVAPLYHYIGHLSDLLGDASLKPSLENVSKREMRIFLQKCISGLYGKKALPKYDFIIADEAQDLFDKGLDLVIKYMLKDNNALQKGSYYIFYDDRQAFPGAEESDPIYIRYIRTRDTLKESSAFYMLFSNLRVNTGHGLEELILDAGNGTADPRKAYGDDVTFITYTDPDEVITRIRRCIDQEVLLSRVDPSEIMVLLFSDLFKKESPLRIRLSSDPQFEWVTRDNFDKPANRIRYTSILSSKGLEWEAVILVFSSLTDAKSQHQLFVGASRARGRGYVLFIE